MSCMGPSIQRNQYFFAKDQRKSADSERGERMVRIKTVIKFHNPFNFNSNNTKVEGPEVSIRVDAPLELLPASG